MRLLHTTRLEFEEFFDDKIPAYAILSHRWQEDEVSYQDWLSEKKRNGIGFSKIINCCKQAVSDGWEWVWIDTCCIDKSSSAELSESINSMYAWYSLSYLCYAYLSDVRSVEPNPLDDPYLSFRNSVWWTRGWTLQELLAPREIHFYDGSWKIIGTKNALIKEISRASEISPYHLTLRYFGHLSIAMRMSWASKRQTSRIEDTAYCLFGLFQINMPLLYGEGRKAFLRLQRKLIKKSDDESIFAWATDSSEALRALLAPSPSYFATSGAITRNRIIDRPPYATTNKGLEFSVPLALLSRQTNGPETVAVGTMPVIINCRNGKNENPLVMNLKQRGDGVWFRVGHNKHVVDESAFQHQEMAKVFIEL